MDTSKENGVGDGVVGVHVGDVRVVGGVDPGVAGVAGLAGGGGQGTGLRSGGGRFVESPAMACLLYTSPSPRD